ncbi:transposable element Tcb2 transposase [Trichonephila clavipes]|nr:transposable element Tcb2 transposase [Trichonephila clavipes]
MVSEQKKQKFRSASIPYSISSSTNRRFSSRKIKGCPVSFQAKKCVLPDDVRLDSGENHMPKMVSNYRRYGPLTARRYRNEILRPIVVSYAAAIGDDFVLMDNNCRPHRANLVEDFLFEEGIVRMEWPACSPDMNPIEHVWDALGRRVAGRQPPPTNSPKTWKELFWKSGTEYTNFVINSLIDSMPQSPRSKADFGTVEIAKEHSEFGASELTQTRCGITESEPFLRILGL